MFVGSRSKLYRYSLVWGLGGAQGLGFRELGAQGFGFQELGV